jgi:outer membrane protein TolC
MNAQQSVTIEQCYAWAEANYPLAKQRELIEKSKAYSVDNISKGIFPQFLVSAQATYQSDVTKIDLPPSIPIEVPSPTKDQYRLTGELSQSLTDFPLNKVQRELKSNEAAIQQQNITVELYKLRERVNQLFFGALLIDEQLKQSDLLKKDIQRGIDQTQSAIDNGVAFRSNLDKLKAEMLKVQQKDIELKAAKKAYLSMLALFTGQDLNENTTLVKPEAPTVPDSIQRPELNIYALQKRSSELQQKLIGLKNIPRLNVFFQGGLGRPSPVNMLSEDFSPFYITGVRLGWSLSGMYSYKKENAITGNDRQSIDVMQNIFLFNTNMALKQQDADVQKYLDLIATDEAIIALRESVKQTSLVQLENGVITTNDYLKEVNEADQARQNKILHDLQLLMVRYAQKTTSGN